MDNKYDIDGSFELFEIICYDVFARANDFHPGLNWDIRRGGFDGQEFFESKRSNRSERVAFNSDDLSRIYHSHYRNLGGMLDPYLGCTGMRPPSATTKKIYELFFEIFDNDRIIRDIGIDIGICSDLGTLYDLLMLNRFITTPVRRILEIGGGYGRLAEHIRKLEKFSATEYILTDSVPASLMFSYLYLKKYLPKLNVGISYLHEYRENFFDIFILPPWELGEQFFNGFELFINIQSFQEMTSQNIEAYNEVLNRLSGYKSMCYFSNEYDYINKSIAHDKALWHTAIESRCPRSWTRDSRTHILEKSRSISHGDVIEFYYNYQLFEYDVRRLLEQEIVEKIGEIEYLDKRLNDLYIHRQPQ